MKNVRHAQQGFTLIELMIVVAIIGILAAIALPAYQDYVGRSQASEALTATSGIRADVGIYQAENAALPGAGDDTEIDAALAALAGRYFAAGGATLSGSGVLQITFDDGVHATETMTITALPNADDSQIIGWECGGSVDPKFLPSACRAAPAAP